MNLRAKVLFRVALASTLLLLIGSFLVDSNGNFPGLGPTASRTVTLLLFTAGIASSVDLLLVEKARRIAAVVFLIILVGLAAPAFF
jgi:hypothetical protein